MVGNLTRLASHVTLFDKTYEAVISFGYETDTLDPFGDRIKEAPLPLLFDFKVAVQKFTGSSMQIPPQYSAIHVNGKRASDLVRSGKVADIPPRPITVYSAKILDTQLTEGRLAYAHVQFYVSKGTYIRCLARDIAKECGSVAHLIALRRTKVGSFSLKKAAGANLLADFTIKNAVHALKADKLTINKFTDTKTLKNICEPSEIEIRKALSHMTASIAQECGCIPVILKDENHFDYFNGKPLKPTMFENIENRTTDTNQLSQYAVFTKKDEFVGIIKKDPLTPLLTYGFVISL